MYIYIYIYVHILYPILDVRVYLVNILPHLRGWELQENLAESKETQAARTLWIWLGKMESLPSGLMALIVDIPITTWWFPVLMAIFYFC